MKNKLKTPQPAKPSVIQGRDLFQTPNYATELLIPFIPRNIEFVWEPACGKFKITDVLSGHGYRVYSSDLGYPDDSDNFLTSNFPFVTYNNKAAIITNPPFSLKKEFYKRCLHFNVPFALLIPTDYCGWLIESIVDENCEKIIPTRRIDFITPSGLSGQTGNTSNFHSMWLTRGFNLGKTETFVELTNEMKKNI